MITTKHRSILCALAAIGLSTAGQAAAPRPSSPTERTPQPGVTIDPRLQLFPIDSKTGLVQINCATKRGGLQPSVIDIAEDLDNDLVRIVVNGKEYTKRTDGVAGYHIELCGRNNSLGYKLGGTTTLLDRARTFVVIGGDSFDYVTFNFATNAAGQYVHVAEPVSLDIDLKELNDQVEFHLFDLDGTTFSVDADLGPGIDGLGFNNYPGTLDGNLSLRVQGGQGDDNLHLDFSDVEVLPDSALDLVVSGDMVDFTGPSNRALHGQDKIDVYYSGLLNGSVTMSVWGDDDLLRSPDYECIGPSGGCVYLSDWSRMAQGLCPGLPLPEINLDGEDAGYCDLEEALRTDPYYAADDIHVFVGPEPGSTGYADAQVDAGLSSDNAELVARYPAGIVANTTARLSGGALNGNAWDVCYGENANITNCEEIDPSISVY